MRSNCFRVPMPCSGGNYEEAHCIDAGDARRGGPGSGWLRRNRARGLGYPLILGSGKRLFPENGQSVRLELRNMKTRSSGVVGLIFEPARSGAEMRSNIP